MKNQEIKVPRRTIALCSLFCRPLYSDSIRGDCEELFEFVYQKRGKLRAHLWLWRQIIKSLPLFLLNIIKWWFILGASYIKIAFRNIIKNKTFSLISIAGLALSVSCFTLPFLFINSNNRIDLFHEHLDEIFYVENRLGKSGGGELWGVSPLPLGPALKQNYPQVSDYIRVNRDSGTVRIKGRIFKEVIYFVDHKFLEVFTFPLVTGNKNALNNRNSIIITDRYAEKYFNDQNPVGKELLIINGDKFKESFVIGGVVKKPPVLSSLEFDILIPHERLKEWRGIDLNDWSQWTHTFLRLKKKEDIAVLKKHSFEKFIQLQNQAEKSWPVLSFQFESFADLSKHADQVNGAIGWGFPHMAIIGLSFGGLMILILGCFSYINIGIVTGARRLREIGIRKVLGSSRLKLIVQFLGEHTLICLAAIVLGAFFTDIFVLPFYNGLFNPPLKLDLLHNHNLWFFYGITLLVTVIGSGGYPALYVSRFKPVSIIKKIQKVGGGSKIVNLFLSFQFILTFLIIGTSMIFIQNATYQKNIDWGYNQQQVINVPLDGKTQYEVYKNAIRKNSNIISISGARNHIGRSWDVKVVQYNGEDYRIPSFAVGPYYLNTLQVRLKKGRTFRRDLVRDDHSIVVNKKLVRAMGWEKAVNQSIEIDGQSYQVIGVVEDFFIQPFGGGVKEPIKPVIFRLCNPKDFRYLSVRVKAGKVVQTANVLENTWKRLFPFQVYEGFYQDSIWAWIYRENTGIYKLSSFIALIALIISCMGLFGLVSVSIIRRLKEISIRKVVGASIINIVKLLNKNILKIIIISSIIAIPLCYIMMDWYLDYCYAFRTPITVWPFIIAALVMIGSSLLSVLSQIIKGARINVVDCLKEE